MGVSVESSFDASVATIDWLAWTLHWRCEVVDDTLSKIASRWLEFFGGGEATTALHGYTRAYSVCGSGRIEWNPERADMGVHIELPGAALGVCDYVAFELLGLVFEAGGRFTRLDLAFDTDVVSVEDFERAYNAGEMVSRASSVCKYERLDSPGKTIYIGGAASRRRVRIYDKAAEQGMDGIEWTRVEVQHRREHAQSAARHLFEGCAPEDLLVSAIDFRLQDDSNVSRRTRSPWFASLVSVARKVNFAIEKVEKSVEKVAEWIKAQVGPSLAFLRLAGVSEAWFDSVVNEGYYRIKSFRRKQAVRYREGGYELCCEFTVS